MDERSKMAAGAWLIILTMSFGASELHGAEPSTTTSACQAAEAAATKSRNRGGRLRAQEQLGIIDTANRKCQRVLAKVIKAKRNAPKVIQSAKSCTEILPMIRKMAHNRASVVIQTQLKKIHRAHNRCLMITKRLEPRP